MAAADLLQSEQRGEFIYVCEGHHHVRTLVFFCCFTTTPVQARGSIHTCQAFNSFTLFFSDPNTV